MITASCRLIYFIHAPCAGGDCTLWIYDYRHIHISIHAPARGATNATLLSEFITFFHPRPARGATKIDPSIGVVRPFQSTPRAGGDFHSVRAGVIMYISIHAPARGATRYCRRDHAGQKFNPPPRAGATPSVILVSAKTVISIHAPCARGATAEFKLCRLVIDIFNPRPLRGGRPGNMCGRCNTRYFNPRPCAGGDRD